MTENKNLKAFVGSLKRQDKMNTWGEEIERKKWYKHMYAWPDRTL